METDIVKTIKLSLFSQETSLEPLCTTAREEDLQGLVLLARERSFLLYSLKFLLTYLYLP